MPLLSPTDQEKLRASFDEMTSPVRLLFIEEVNFILEKDKASQYGIDRVPAIALEGADRDSRIRFLGTPAGYEFISLVQAVLLVGGRAPSLTAENLKRVAAVDKPITMKVFTTPT